MTTLGFVGLGEMGGPMSRHLVAAGHEVVAFDRDADAVAATVEAGGRGADSVAGVADAADVVFLSLPGPEEVRAVVAESESSLSAGDAVVDLSTSTPATTRNLADRLGDRGVGVVGAPVSGGTDGARDGTLTVMAAGDEATVEACDPYFEAFAADVFHIGPDPGHGHAVKLLNNYLSFVAMLATSEAVVLGEEIGLDATTMCEVFQVSTGRNTATEYKFPDYVVPGKELGFTLDLVDKDIRLMTRFGEDNHVPLLLANVVRAQVGYARNRYGDDGDMVKLYDYLAEAMGGAGRDGEE